VRILACARVAAHRIGVDEFFPRLISLYLAQGFRWQVSCVVLLPVGLHLCLPHGDHRYSKHTARNRVTDGTAAFSDRVEDFKKIGAEVVACSVDSKFTHLAWTERSRREGGLGPMNIPLLSDLTHKIAQDYGVLITQGEDAG
jgi:hypothetical protein